MKALTLKIGLIVLISNIIFGILISKYTVLNICLNSVIIAITTAMIMFVNSTKIKDAFKFSLSFIFFFGGLVEFTCGLFYKSSIYDNWIIALCTIITILEMALLTTIVSISKNNKS